MTNHEEHEEYWNPEVHNDFKCLEWKARIQAEILHETEGMTREEVREYFRLASERAALRRKALTRLKMAESQT